MVERIALSLLGIVVGLACCEVVVRLFALGPRVVFVREGRYRLAPNPVRGYEPVPGFVDEGKALRDDDWRGETSALGYRGPDYPKARRPGTVRVAVLGDSLAAGLGIKSYRETFPGVLETWLRDRGVESEVLNFGVVGYNTRQELETLKDVALGFSPDLVVVQYCSNDHERNDGALLQRLLDKEKAGRDAGGVQITGLLSRSALYRLIRFRLSRRPDPGGAALDSGSRLQRLSEDTVEESIRGFGEVARQHNLRIMLAVFPRFDELESGALSIRAENAKRVARESGLYVMDLSEDLRACRDGSPRPLGFDEFHPTVAGHRCAGEALGSALLPLVPAGRTGSQ